MTNSTMINVEIAADSRVETDALHLMDRCDRCGAAALVRAVKDDMSLLFCGHHANAAIAGLVSGGWKIDDQTHTMFPEGRSAKSANENSTFTSTNPKTVR